MENPRFLIYGSTGYTGKLIVGKALEKGLKPILAGRNEAKVRAQAEEAGLEWKVFSLKDEHAMNNVLQGVDVVLHCAGPFSHTYESMAKACLNSRTHYLDITGEISVFEGLKQLDLKAKVAGIMLLPGVGFDVVPTDCLAARLKAEMPEAKFLELAFYSAGGGMSHGTAKTTVENLHVGSMVRKDGKIIQIPAASITRKIDFGKGEMVMSTIPWGDISTAFHSTEIPNIIVYSYLTGGMRFFSTIGRPFWGLFKAAWLQDLLKRQIEKQAPGPSLDSLAKYETHIWGEVRDAKGNSREGWMKTSQGYDFTAEAALLIVQKVLTGEVKVGFQTPSSAFGWEIMDEIPGVEWKGF